MKKRKSGIKLSRGQAARKALFRSLIRALVEHGSIETTEVKAKSLEKKIAKLVNFARTDSVITKRKIYSYLGNDRDTTDKLYEITKRNFTNQKGGFTKMVRLSERRGDGARLVQLEWVKDMTKTEKQKSDKEPKNKKSVSKKK